MNIITFFQSRSCTVNVLGKVNERVSSISVNSYSPPFYTELLAVNIENTIEYWEILGSKLIAVLANGAKFKNIHIYDGDTLEKFVENYFVTLSPEEKLDAILGHISSRARYDGQLISLNAPTDNEANKFYFANTAEWLYYADLAIKLNLLSMKSHAANGNGYQLTLDGLKRTILMAERSKSTQCFLAMAFQEDMFRIAREAIKPALEITGFQMHMVNEQQLASDITINDAILAGIKKAHFTIADFTHHRGGVYFEAGYALGRGQQVIYTCRHDEMSKSHFDLRNYQHIVWTDGADFKQKLIDKIEAFIKD